MSKYEDTVGKMVDDLGLDESVAEKILDTAIRGGETTEDNAGEWFDGRFKPNYVEISQSEYAEMCVSALKILTRTAATDFGGARQRDLGQLWADMTRGYLGEYAVVKFLKNRWNIESELGHHLGELEEFLPTDIHKVKTPGDSSFRDPKLQVGIKTTKFSGMWLDIPGDQFNHSDVHILVKVGTGRDHLFAFFKEISVFKDKVLKTGIEGGTITEEEAEQLFNSLPDFAPIPAYICGFVERSDEPREATYEGKKGRIHYTITAWNGPMSREALDKIREENEVEGDIKFEAIGRFAHDRMYLFNTGNLKWKEKDWDGLIAKL